jgi:transcriptional regulator with XRE-family HTH domain
MAHRAVWLASTPEQHMRALGEAIRQRRREQNLSLERVAWEMGMASHSLLSQIERGKGNPTAVKLDLLAKVLDVTPAELYRKAESILYYRSTRGKKT